MDKIKTENGNFFETLSIHKEPKTEIDRNQRRNERKMRQSKKRSESTNGFSPLYSTIIQVQMHTVFLLSIGWLLFFFSFADVVVDVVRCIRRSLNVLKSHCSMLVEQANVLISIAHHL